MIEWVSDWWAITLGELFSRRKKILTTLSLFDQGEAEAYAIEVKAKAEAEQMAKKADAWKEYKEAALVDMMLQVARSIIEKSGFSISNCLNLKPATSSFWVFLCTAEGNNFILFFILYEIFQKFL